MGFEYEVRPGGIVDADQVLRSLPGFRGVEPRRMTYEFGEGAIPVAHAHVSADGIVFCVNAEPGRRLLALLVATIEARGQTCRVVDLWDAPHRVSRPLDECCRPEVRTGNEDMHATGSTSRDRGAGARARRSRGATAPIVGG